MNAELEFSAAEINAFVDGRLESQRRRELLEAMAADPAFGARVRRLQATNGLIEDVYSRVPVPPVPGWLRRGRRSQAVAALLALALIGGGFLGWWISRATTPAAPVLQSLAQFDQQPSAAGKILLHISTADPDRVHAALDAAERILSRSREQHRLTRLEIVANAEGLAILREGSPYAERIERMLHQYDTVSFKACGIAMETARLKEGVEVQLLPEAEKVDAALDQILTRIRQGWTYIRA